VFDKPLTSSLFFVY